MVDLRPTGFDDSDAATPVNPSPQQYMEALRMGVLNKDRRTKRGVEESDQKVDDATFQAQLRLMSPTDLLALIKKQTHETYELDMQILSHTDNKYIGTRGMHLFVSFRGPNFPSILRLWPIHLPTFL